MNYRGHHASGIVKERHGKFPMLRALPNRALLVIVIVAIMNMFCWVGVGVVLVALTGASVLAYTLGLRHALDADHITAINLATRGLVASGHRPATAGLFLSLGHSSVVIATSIAVAGTATGVSKRFDDFARVGGIIGTSASAAFLIMLGAMNIYVLYRLFKHLDMLMRSGQEGVLFGEGVADYWDTPAAGYFPRMCRWLFGLIDRPWKMYPLGVLFGLGFDTSSEVALLGIASIQAEQGTSIWLILIFPVLFTAGMCLIGTTHGALMLTLYTTPTFAHDDIAIVYHSIALTITTVVVAISISVIQILSLVHHVLEPSGAFWDGVGRMGGGDCTIGGCIAGLFVVTGITAHLVYKPVRKIIDQKRLLMGPSGSAPSWEDVSIPPADSPGGADTTNTGLKDGIGTGGNGEVEANNVGVRHFEDNQGTSVI
ncbi:NicO-domain-containing protein [Tuber magnatum]|uniref:Nickel/cobalt efflux system n=1 Tax=Tuber magnatum TaxID=42249 RepID=A0A317SQG0_9PEZI|nr:NicO-domain-containing protein [Tuber magnatum]